MFFLIYLNIFFILLFVFWIYLNFQDSVLYLIAFLLFFFTLSLFLSFIYFLFELIWERKNFVPFVPTSNKVAKKMIELADIKDNHKVYDLWSWDWKILFLAAKNSNAKFEWIEKKFDVWLYWKIRSLFWENVNIKIWNMFNYNYSDADVIFLYLLPITMKNLEKKLINELKPWTVIISNWFEFVWLKSFDEQKIWKSTIRKYIIK